MEEILELGKEVLVKMRFVVQGAFLKEVAEFFVDAELADVILDFLLEALVQGFVVGAGIQVDGGGTTLNDFLNIG